MKTIEQIPYKAPSPCIECEYIPVVIVKNGSENAYGIAVHGTRENKLLCVKEIGTDKELALSIVDTLNKYTVPYVHFLDIVNDMMNE